MVFLSRMMSFLWKDHTNPFTGFKKSSLDRYWTRRRVKMMTAHYFGRRRNCYTIGVRFLIRALTNSTRARKLRKRDFRSLCDQRIEAGAAELNYNAWYIKEALHRCHVLLNTKVMANMAIWEPRSFRSVVAVAAQKSMQPSTSGGLGLPSCGPGTEVIDRNKL